MLFFRNRFQGQKFPKYFSACLRFSFFGLFICCIPFSAKAQIVGILGHFPGVQEIDYVSVAQAWVSIKTSREQGAALDECSLIYFEIPKAMADMGAPLSFVGRKDGFQLRALNSEWPILPNQRGRLSIKIKNHIYKFKMQSDEAGTITGPMSGAEIKEIFNALESFGQTPYAKMTVTYAQEQAATDGSDHGSANRVSNHMNGDRASRAQAARQKRLNRAPAHLVSHSFSVSVQGIAKTIESFNACMKEISEKQLH